METKEQALIRLCKQLIKQYNTKPEYCEVRLDEYHPTLENVCSHCKNLTGKFCISIGKYPPESLINLQQYLSTHQTLSSWLDSVK